MKHSILKQAKEKNDTKLKTKRENTPNSTFKHERKKTEEKKIYEKETLKKFLLCIIVININSCNVS